jgi:hypothetical protein
MSAVNFKLVKILAEGICNFIGCKKKGQCFLLSITIC